MRFTCKPNLCIIVILCVVLLLSSCSDDPASGSTGAAPNAATSRAFYSATADSTTPAITLPVQTISATATMSTVTGGGDTIVVPTSKPSVATPQDWEYNWIRGIPCRAPCYLNITPGQSTRQQALQALKSNPDVIQIKDEDNCEGTNLTNVQLDWLLKSQLAIQNSQTNFANVPCYDKNQIVDRIQPYFSKGFKFSDIIASYGEPSHVRGSINLDLPNEAAWFRLNLLYLSQGFLLRVEVYSKSLADKPSVNPNLIINDGVLFFTPGAKNLEQELLLEQAVKWQGNKDFDFYCRRISNKQEIIDCAGITLENHPPKTP